MTSPLAALTGGASDLAVVQSPPAQPSLASAGSVEAASTPAAIVTFSSAAVAALQVGSSNSSPESLARQYQSWATTINDPNASDSAKAAAYAAFTATSTVADVHYGYSTESDLDKKFWKEVGHSTFMTVNLGAAQNAYSSVQKNYFDAHGWGPGLDEAGLQQALIAGGNGLSGSEKTLYFAELNSENKTDVLMNTKPGTIPTNTVSLFGFNVSAPQSADVSMPDLTSGSPDTSPTVDVAGAIAKMIEADVAGRPAAIEYPFGGTVSTSRLA